jgi:1-acyl-sn-glycerol-3-phosphate acyltransferase
MKNWSLAYELYRYFVRYALWLSHKRIVVTGSDDIPHGKPIIFAANHQNALMDSLAIVCTNPSQSVWLARADIFKSKIAHPFLKFLKISPVYRIRDGKDNLANNEAIFASVTQLLENNDTTALFPEAAHSGRRKMLPHKKAIPRIALEAENKNHFKLGLNIVPVGIFYSHYWNFNRTVIVQYGKPIEVDNYKEQFESNPQRSMLKLRDEIHDRLEPLTMQINSELYYFDYENIRELAGETWASTRQFSKDKTLQLFHAESDLIKKVEQLETANPDEFQQLIEKTRAYYGALKSNKICDHKIKSASKANLGSLLMKLIGSVIAIPIILTGLIFNAIPFFVPRHLLKKKVKDKAFTSTFYFASGLFIFPLFYLLESLIILSLTKSWMITIAALLLMPLSGKYAYQLFEYSKLAGYELSYLISTSSSRRKIQALIKQRKELIDSIIR